MQNEFELEEFGVKFSHKAKNSAECCYIDAIHFSDKWSTIEFIARKSNNDSLEKIKKILKNFHCWINHKRLKPYETLNKFLFDIKVEEKKNKIIMKIDPHNTEDYNKYDISVNIKDLLTYSSLLFNEEMLNEVIKNAPKNSSLAKFIPESHTSKLENDQQHIKAGYIELK
jgi:hypothetical protein